MFATFFFSCFRCQQRFTIKRCHDKSPYMRCNKFASELENINVRNWLWPPSLDAIPFVEWNQFRVRRRKKEQRQSILAIKFFDEMQSRFIDGIMWWIAYIIRSCNFLLLIIFIRVNFWCLLKRYFCNRNEWRLSETAASSAVHSVIPFRLCVTDRSSAKKKTHKYLVMLEQSHVIMCRLFSL